MTEPPILTALRHALQTRVTSLALTEVWRERQEALDYLDELRALFPRTEPDAAAEEARGVADLEFAKELLGSLGLTRQVIERGRDCGKVRLVADAFSSVRAEREAWKQDAVATKVAAREIARELASALCVEQGSTFGRMWDPLPDIDAARAACRKLLAMVNMKDAARRR